MIDTMIEDGVIPQVVTRYSIEFQVGAKFTLDKAYKVHEENI